MKIIKIEKLDSCVYSIHLSPNVIEELIGIKPKVVQYKDIGKEYWSGKQTAYVKQDGTFCENGDYIADAIDNWRRTF
jgi:hypothetical protein